jgi:hypothetical protein
MGLHGLFQGYIYLNSAEREKILLKRRLINYAPRHEDVWRVEE